LVDHPIPLILPIKGLFLKHSCVKGIHFSNLAFIHSFNLNDILIILLNCLVL
jgi:hypothetical protein